MLRETLLRLSISPAIGRGLERLPVSRRVVRRFVAGEPLRNVVDKQNWF